MKQFLTFLFSTILTIAYGQRTHQPLFQIWHGNKIGFIDAKGKVVIKPTFISAGEFSEGLAFARMNGTYGYIDSTGNFIIKPEFDYATPFEDGLAIVYKSGRPFYINKKGQKPFEIDFPIIGPFETGKAKFKTATKKFGIIDKNGRLIIDTVFTRIRFFIQGMAVVEGLNHQTGVIDTLGNFIIPYGKYNAISDFKNGYFKVSIPEQPQNSYSGQKGFVDKTGKLILLKNNEEDLWIAGDVHCGLARMNLSEYRQPQKDGETYPTKINYEGFINLKGQVIVNDTNYVHVEDFSCNRAFVQDKDWNFFIIDTQGQLVSKDTFSNINMFIGGYNKGFAFVEKDGLYGMIDTNANFIFKPQFEEIHQIGIIDDYFFYCGDFDSDDFELYGLAKTDGTILIKPIISRVDVRGFQYGLLKCIVKNKLTYINKKGEIIWQESSTTSEKFSCRNIDFMDEAYYWVGLESVKNDSEEFIDVKNKISKSDKFPENSLSVVVYPGTAVNVDEMYKGIKVVVANTTKNKISFNTDTRRLYMKVQAKDPRGEWKYIEYMEGNWCGNAYYTLTLEPQYYWSFITYVYEGDFHTKLRLELKYIDPEDKSEDSDDKKELTIYSNEYEGSINPGQFWRTRNDHQEWENFSLPMR